MYRLELFSSIGNLNFRKSEFLFIRLSHEKHHYPSSIATFKYKIQLFIYENVFNYHQRHLF